MVRHNCSAPLAAGSSRCAACGTEIPSPAAARERAKRPVHVDPGVLGRAGAYARGYLIDAAYSQLAGIFRGILADEQVADGEIRFLDQWLDQHQPPLPEWPTRALVERVQGILADGAITEDERLDLAAFLVQLAPKPEQVTRQDAASALPFTIPQPPIVYEGHGFCLTGTVLFGTRRDVEAAITTRSGKIATVARADYLVIGATITPAWKYGTHGLKIEEAAARCERSDVIGIIDEQYWHDSLS